MQSVKVGSAANLKPGCVMEVMVGDTPYAICNAGGTFTALAGVCPHRGGPLGQGAIHETNVVCPWHAWEWNCSTGENDMDPAQKVATYEVTIEGGEIVLHLPA